MTEAEGSSSILLVAASRILVQDVGYFGMIFFLKLIVFADGLLSDKPLESSFGYVGLCFLAV